MKMAYRVDKDVFEYIDKCEGIKVIYGVTFGEDIIKENIFRVDFFCDRREGGKGKYIKNIPIITVLELSEIITRSGKRALILICVGPNEAAVHSIYGDLCRYDIDADVFNYFNSNCFFRDKTFLYKDKIFKLYENIYNCGFINTRMTERSVELALGEYFIEKCMGGGICEVGAVTPYYPFECANRVKHVIDPTDMHKRVDIRRSVFDCNLRGWNVLSISTVEHIGTGDYKFSEKHTAVEAVVKILRESKSCLITAPIGYNAVLDEWVYDNRHDVRIKLLKRGCNNHWDNDEGKNIKDIKYGPYWANGLIVIEK